MSTEYDPTDVHRLDREEAEKKAAKRIKESTEEGDLKWLMSSRQGRRIVWRLLSTAGVFQLSFNQNAMVMSFNEGRRNYGNLLLSQINSICPDLYPRMAKEANDERNGDGRNDKYK